MIDSSSSVSEPNFRKILEFMVGMLRDADIDNGKIRVGVLSYNTDVTTHFFLNEHTTKSGVFQAIRAIRYSQGSTNTADALKSLREEMFNPTNGARRGVTHVAFVITDGVE